MLLTLALALAVQQPGGTLIVTNKTGASASIIDVAGGRVLAELPTGYGPHEVVASRDGRTAVVTNYGAQDAGNTLTVIDVAGRRVARTLDLGMYYRPHGIAFMPGDSVVAVTSETTRSVVLVRVADGRIVRSLPTAEDGSHMLGVIADGTRIYTGNIPAGNVSEIEVATDTRTRAFEVPPQPEAITVSPDGRSVLVPDYRGGSLRIVDRSTRTERARVALGGPQGIAVSGDSRYAFVSLPAEDAVAIVDIAAARVVGRLPAGSRPDGVAWSPL